jgi:hypothetical protein
MIELRFWRSCRINSSRTNFNCVLFKADFTGFFASCCRAKDIGGVSGFSGISLGEGASLSGCVVDYWVS